MTEWKTQIISFQGEMLIHSESCDLRPHCQSLFVYSYICWFIWPFVLLYIDVLFYLFVFLFVLCRSIRPIRRLARISMRSITPPPLMAPTWRLTAQWTALAPSPPISCKIPPLSWRGRPLNSTLVSTNQHQHSSRFSSLFIDRTVKMWHDMKWVGDRWGGGAVRWSQAGPEPGSLWTLGPYVLYEADPTTVL